jgi:DNA-binding XRE family transcriptional regulator
MRDKLEVAAAELAKLIGFSPQSIYNREHEKSTPRSAR